MHISYLRHPTSMRHTAFNHQPNGLKERYLCSRLTTTKMVIRVVEFLKGWGGGGTKLERFLHKNQHVVFLKEKENHLIRINIPKGNYWILRTSVVGRCQRVPKFYFQSQFSVSKIIQISLIFFPLKNTILGAHFLIASIFNLLLLKWCPIFDSSPLNQFSKFNNFLLVCWF